MSCFSDIMAKAGFLQDINLGDIVLGAVCVLGVIFFSVWLIIYSGPFALRNSPVRRHCMGYHIGFSTVIAWAVLVLLVQRVVLVGMAGSSGGIREFMSYLATAGLEMAMIGLILFIAWHKFARRLKGFGLDFRTAGKDFGMAVVNLVTAMPMVMLALVVVDAIGRLSVGPQFKIQTNEGLTAIEQSPEPVMQALIVVFVVVVTPVFEEFLFRGILQSTLKGLLLRPWPAIIAASVMFAVLHPSTHWPAMFMLSMCMGYAYEKSGSLLRSVFVHAMFNATSVAAMLWG